MLLNKHIENQGRRRISEELIHRFNQNIYEQYNAHEMAMILQSHGRCNMRAALHLLNAQALNTVAANIQQQYYIGSSVIHHIVNSTRSITIVKPRIPSNKRNNSRDEEKTRPMSKGKAEATVNNKRAQMVQMTPANHLKVTRQPRKEPGRAVEHMVP